MGNFKLELTKLEFHSLIDIIDTISGMIGVGSEFDLEQSKNVVRLDKMLKKNGYKRNLK